jgi:hypothetical protein
MRSDSEDASQSFETVREPEGSATRATAHQSDSRSSQKYHNAISVNRSSVLEMSNKQSTGEDDDMSPRFLTNK